MPSKYEIAAEETVPFARSMIARALVRKYKMKEVEVAERLGVAQAVGPQVGHFDLEDVLARHQELAHGDLPGGAPDRANVFAVDFDVRGIANPAGLNSLGGNLYRPTDASGDPVIGNPGGQEGIGSLLQGYLESSNVSVVQEFINLIVSQRAYEANSKVVKAADDMYSEVNNLR